MFLSFFVYLSSILSLYGAILYIRSALSGATTIKPISFVAWFFALLVGLIISIENSGFKLSLVPVIFDVFGLALIVFVAILLRAKQRVEALDYACGIMSVFAVILWIALRQDEASVLVIIFADFIAGIPIIKKAFLYPKSENGTTWLLSFIASVFGIVSASWGSFFEIALPLYLFVYMLIVSFLVNRGKLFNYLGIKKA